jgi:hypothetical protein
MSNRRKAAFDAAVAAGDPNPMAVATKIAASTHHAAAVSSDPEDHHRAYQQAWADSRLVPPPSQATVVRTVELELERALFEAGCLIESNLGDLDRMVS